MKLACWCWCLRLGGNSHVYCWQHTLLTRRALFHLPPPSFSNFHLTALRWTRTFSRRSAEPMHVGDACPETGRQHTGVFCCCRHTDPAPARPAPPAVSLALPHAPTDRARLPRASLLRRRGDLTQRLRPSLPTLW